MSCCFPECFSTGLQGWNDQPRGAWSSSRPLEEKPSLWPRSRRRGWRCGDMEDWGGGNRWRDGGCASEALGCIRSTEHSEEVVGDFSASAATQRHLSGNQQKPTCLLIWKNIKEFISFIHHHSLAPLKYKLVNPPHFQMWNWVSPSMKAQKEAFSQLENKSYCRVALVFLFVFLTSNEFKVTLISTFVIIAHLLSGFCVTCALLK